MMLANNSIRRISSRSFYGRQRSLFPSASNNLRWMSSSEPTDTTDDETEEVSPPPPTAEAPTPAPVAPKVDVGELENNMRPLEIVSQLDRHIVGQHDAKRAVAIAMRNRWRRQQLPDELRKEVTPRNVLLVGPTGKWT